MRGAGRNRCGHEPLQPGVTTALMRLWGWLFMIAALILLVACNQDDSIPTSNATTPIATASVVPRPSTPTPTFRSSLPATVGPPNTPSPRRPLETAQQVTSSPHMSDENGLPEPMEDPDPTVRPPGVHTSFPAAPDRDLVELARSLRLKTADTIRRVAGAPTVQLVPGLTEEFKLTSLDPVSTYSREFVLRHVSPNAYWYVQVGLSVSDDDLLRASEAFENDVYPRTIGLWGTEWKPGVDEDPRMTILNGRLRGGAAGYFSSADEYPKEVHPHSNEREMLYMNAEYLPVGSSQYLAVLTHELFHAVAWAADPSEDTWVSEGMAELSTWLLGRYPGPPYAEVPSPTPSLVNWPLDPLSGANYAYSMLFFQYLSQRLDMPHDLIRLVEQPANGVEGVDAYLRSLEGDLNFRKLFSDWLVANLLDESEGSVYGYKDIDVGVFPMQGLGQGGVRKSALHQYSAEYVELTEPTGSYTLYFQGVSETPLLDVNVDADGCWWSNSGDSISSTLTRRVDLSEAESASLRYRIWHEIEEGWDYGYVEVSTNGGVTWDVLAAEGTTTEDPAGNSYGPGYTGTTQDWRMAQADLSPYSGREVDVRFHYITDDSVHGSGLCIDDISIPEIGFDGGLTDTDWRAEGFLVTSNRVMQDYLVHVVEIGPEPRVTSMTLDGMNRGELKLSASEQREGTVVVVGALAPKTRERAAYTLRLEAGSVS